MKKIIFSLVLSAGLLAGNYAFAVVDAPTSHIADQGTITSLFEDAREKGQDSAAKQQDVILIIGDIIKTVLGLMGIVFLILMIYAGIHWMTAEGEEAKVTKARNTITTAVIGLIITLSAYAIAYFVVENLQRTTGVK